MGGEYFRSVCAHQPQICKVVYEVRKVQKPGYWLWYKKWKQKPGAICTLATIRGGESVITIERIHN